MKNPMTPEELENLKKLVDHVSEQSQKRNSNAAALEEARKEIRDRGRFVPKVDQPATVEICF